MEFKKMGFDGGSYPIRTKVINQSDLTSECWMIQAWGMYECVDCENLATDDCGGYRIRKEILNGRYPVSGLSG